ncbi:MAG: RNA polymerase sigma factor [Bacteroidia bacterium]
METEDKNLLEQFRNETTRSSAFNSILSKYQKRLYWHIRKMVIDHDDTDDILQNTFIKVWKSLDNFREDAQLYTWLYRIATNECLTFLAKKKNSNTISINEVEYSLHEKIDSEKNYTGEEIQRKLQKAILTLPEKQRLVFNMKYFDAMKYEEMSVVLETSVGALKASYHHAVKKIEHFITNG